MIAFKGGARSSSGSRSGSGKSFRGLAAYLTQGHRESQNPERVEWTSTRNLDNIEDPTAAAKIMRAHAEQNPRVERPVYHFGLSLAEGEHLTPEQWNAAIDRVLDRMGLSAHQVLVVAHGDTDFEHVHVVVNRVGEDGRAWNARRDMVKANEALHEIEREHGLRRTGRRELPPPELSPPAYQEARRTGMQPLADRVREEAGPDLARATSWRDLDEQLASNGFRLESAERGSGVVVSDGVRHASLSHIDRELSGPKLAERFGETFREYRAHDPEPPAVQAPSGVTGAEALPGRSLGQRASALVERVNATRATFTEADLRRAAFYQPDSAALVREALKPERVVDLGREIGGATRYTTHRYLEAEAYLYSAAERLGKRNRLRLEESRVARTIERSPTRLSDEQRAAVLHATTDADLAQVVGRAGAGKTTAARVIAEAYRDQGYEVRGAALAGKAAEGLEREAGIPSRTLASLERAWAEGRERLDKRTVLVVDEAGMLDTRQLARVLHQADQGDAKVVLLGDPDQLKAIGPGDAYRGLLERHECANLETVRRQAEPWQRAASEDLAAGRVSAALDSYDVMGRLHWTGDRASARAELVSRYLEDRRERPEGGQLIVAYRNADVQLLNEAVRSERQARGELGPGVTLRGAEYAAGDRVVFLKNDHSGREVANLDRGEALAGVKNGTLGTIERAEEHRFAVRLDDGRRVAFDPQQYPDIAHGYAVTIHKSQGATVDRVYALADPLMNRNTSYVALTRHREDFHLYADRGTFRHREGLDKVLSRASHKDLAYDYAAADLGRIGERVSLWQERAHTLRRQELSLRDDLNTLDGVPRARRDLDAARVEVEKAAGRIYANPQEATRALLADPKATDRLAAHEAGAYGELRGHARVLLGKDAQRLQAEREIPGLRGALRSHGEAEKRFTRRQGAASKITNDVGEIKALLQRATSTLRQVEALSRGPEQALELAVRHLGHQAARAVTSLLPAPARAPLRLAVRALERVLDIGLDLGR